MNQKSAKENGQEKTTCRQTADDISTQPSFHNKRVTSMKQGISTLRIEDTRKPQNQVNLRSSLNVKYKILSLTDLWQTRKSER